MLSVSKVTQRNFLPPLSPGDLVRVHFGEWTGPGEFLDPRETGLVLQVIDDVEIPPLIEVLWEDGYVCRTYQDELVLVRKKK